MEKVIDLGFGIIELELGTLLLLVSLVALLVDVFLVFFGKYIEKWENLSELSLMIGSTTLIISFCYFSYSVLSGDYSLIYVRNFVSNDMDFFLRLSAIWSGQAGSYFFWAFLILICYLIFRQSFRYNAHETVIWRSFLFSGLQVATMTALTLLTNPFEINHIPTDNGYGLNPLLMNIWNIIHPPIIFIGYALCMLPAVIAIAKISTLEDGKVPDFESKKSLDRFLEFNISLAWLILSSGIVIGAYWAYVTLGWGGFWAWDPVETGSLIPWLFLTLYYHGKHFHSKNHFLKNYVISMTYIAVLFATFITRSNIIESVHAFQADNSLVLLFFILIATFALPHILGIRGKAITRMLPSLTRSDFQASRARPTALKISYITGIIGTYIIIIGLIAPAIYGLLVSYFPFLLDVFQSLGMTLGPSITIGPSFYNTVAAVFGGILLITQFFCTFYPNLDIRKKFILATGGFAAGIIFVVGGWGFFDSILGKGNPITAIFGIFWTRSDKANLIIPLLFLGVVGLIIEFIQITMKETQDLIRKSSQTMLHLSFLVIILGAVMSANTIVTQEVWVQQDGTYDIPGTSIQIRIMDIDTTLPPVGSRTLISYETEFILVSGTKIIGFGITRLGIDSVYGNDHDVTIVSALFADVYIVTTGISANPISGILEQTRLQIKVIPYISILWVGCLMLHFAILPLTISKFILLKESLSTRKKDVETTETATTSINAEHVESSNEYTDKEENSNG
ncbi:MAG: cytochrome c biogenesis protein CcsA [Candidatus Odinarchaeota archaeon]